MVLSLIKRIQKHIARRQQPSPEPDRPPLTGDDSRSARGSRSSSRKHSSSAPVKPAAAPRPGGAAGRSSRRRGRRPKKSPRGESRVTAPAAAHGDWTPADHDVPPVEGKTRFHDLDLPDELLHAVADLGFQYCSPIQSEILPATLTGKDASGQAQTGTGKTAAFLITILTHLHRNPKPDRPGGEPRALILAPTRELVIQIAEEAELLAKYLPVHIATVYGGMDYHKQLCRLTEKTVDIVVATPGRMIAYSEHGDARLGNVEILVLDEADRMLDMGFIPQVRRLVRQTPYKEKRQTMMFSATMVGEVERMMSSWTIDPVYVEVAPGQVESDSVEQIVYLTTSSDKFALLYNIIVRQDLKRIIIFCNRRDETQRLNTKLQQYNVSCAVISGEIPQKKRIKTLEDFRGGAIRVLVATDVAGRGIHIDGISHVINYTLPHDPENYVHRIGRTGRAGATGTSISFASEDDSFYIPGIEEFIGHELPCVQPEPDYLILPALPRKSGARRTGPEKRPPARNGDGSSRPSSRRRRRRPTRSGSSGSGDTGRARMRNERDGPAPAGAGKPSGRKSAEVSDSSTEANASSAGRRRGRRRRSRGKPSGGQNSRPSAPSAG